MFRSDVGPPQGIRPVWHTPAAHAYPGTRAPLHPFPPTGPTSEVTATPQKSSHRTESDQGQTSAREAATAAAAACARRVSKYDYEQSAMALADGIILRDTQVSFDRDMYNAGRGMYRPKNLPGLKPDPVTVANAPIAGARPAAMKDWDYMRPHNVVGHTDPAFERSLLGKAAFPSKGTL